MQKEHFEILLENIDGKFNVILEGYSVLAKQIEDTRSELKEDINLLDVKITALSKRVDTVEINLSARIDEVETSLGARIDDVATDLKDQRKETAQQFEAVHTKIDAVATDLKAHRLDTEAHRSLYAVREG